MRAELKCVTTVGFVLLMATVASAQSIGWNFMQTGSEAVGGVAGFSIYAQDNWNDDGPNGQSAAGGISNLIDDSGAATTVDVSWTTTAGNSWFMGSANSTPDQRLNNGFLNQQPSLSVTDLPSEYTDNGYSLVIYYNNNEGPGTSDVAITGSIDDILNHQIITGPTGSTRFDENGYLFEDGSLLGPTNVTLFDGLDDPNFTIDFTNVAGSQNNGITAFQIVANEAAAVPEPNSWMIMCVVMGVALFFHLARRRQGIRT